MHLKSITPKQALNKAYLKEKIGRDDVELFKANFIDLLNKTDDKGDEEHLKSLVSDFLKLTWYNKAGFQINPKGKTDLIIHNGKLPSDPAGVLLEVKSPSNTAEMVSEAKPNAKALHEIILYYLTERITNNKHDVKHLVITNINEWFVFDANEFDKKIYRSTSIKKLFEQKKNDGKDNPWFYEELKKLFTTNELSLEHTWFNINTYKKQAFDSNSENDKQLIPLFKILSPVHLLKLPFANDSNSLQPKFYTELLHIIGLYEYKDGGKKLISRKKPGERNAGSLLENAIVYLDSHDKISRLDKASQYGATYDERLYNAALELVITWVNRILFLKLLEAQLLNYHKKDKAYTFLNKDKIKDFDDLDKLFFRVLAKRVDERSDEIMRLFSKVPYLNSSLFEPTELEHQTMFISGLEDFVALPVISSTVLKDGSKTRKGSLETLDYLFDFLNAYDFSSEGSEEIQEDNKTLINASVLGLIFEKINGYKDGSFFTPGFITMYMCRETIRRAVVQKFNDAKGWDIKEYSDLHNQIDNSNRKEANAIINTLKICDPAVGSGHFLVSALNEIIAIKSDLNVLMSEDGRTLNNYTIEVVNDELVITDENADPFKYHYQDHRSQAVQKTLFHEKQTIIENCLFGVDINPNSVKICRLRLWIELLKNAYYKPTAAGELELETLPNIDINIKTGNSLISRFALDADLSQALRESKWNINDYRIAVGAYKNATDKAAKRDLVELIDKIKTNFRTSISRNSREYKELAKVRGQLNQLVSTNQDLFGVKKSKKDLALEQRRLEILVENKEQAIEDIKNNKIYENAFEWRFEFPEVLSNDGEFLGFDAIIGNPPYMIVFDENLKRYYETLYIEFKRNNDLYIAFFARSSSLLRKKAQLSLITPNTYIKGDYFKLIREYLSKKTQIVEIIDFGKLLIFNEVSVFCSITSVVNTLPNRDWPLKSDITRVKGIVTVLSNDFVLKNDLIKKLDLLPKFSNYFEIKDVGFNYWSEGRGKTRGDSIGSRVFYNGIQQSDDDIPFIKGADITKYVIGYSNNYLRGNWKTFLDQKDTFRFSQEFFEKNPKIIYRQTSNKIVAAIDYNQNFNDKTIHILINKPNYNYDLKIILALLNSKLLNYFFQAFKEEDGRAFAQVKTVDVKNLPFPESDLNNTSIKTIMDRLLILKEKNKDTSQLEIQIDQLVYQLYNLTPEEIKIVEGEAY